MLLSTTELNGGSQSTSGRAELSLQLLAKEKTKAAAFGAGLGLQRVIWAQ